jgi:hypothetical protein
MNVFRTPGACRKAIILSQILLLIPSAVQAADDKIRLGGQVVFEAQAASDGMTVDDRAQSIQRNLDNALVAAQDRSPASVNIVYVKGVPVITLGGYQVVTVNNSDAKDAGTTPAILAQRWADALKNTLKDAASVSRYIAQLTGAPAGGPPPTSSAPTGAMASAAPANLPPSVPPPPYAGGGAPYGAPPSDGAGMPASNNDQYNRATGTTGVPPYQGGAYTGGGYPGGPPAGYPGGGYPGGGYPGGPGGGYMPQGYPMQGRVVYAQAGTIIPISLKTSISTQAASPGDLILADASGGATGDANIPPGTVLVGQIVEAKAGGFLGRSGMLEVKFNRMRTPDGMEVPISAHIKGGIGKYAVGADGEIHGETWKTKVGQGLMRGAIGAGAGAALGTAVGAIAGAGMRKPGYYNPYTGGYYGGGSYAGHGAGTGAWSGAAIGGGVGVADSLLLRKGHDVTIKSGTSMEIQLDSPVSMGGGMPGMMNGGGMPGMMGGMPQGGMPNQQY